MTERGYTAQQIRDAEAPLLAGGAPLMRRAADGLAREIQTVLPADAASVLLLVGSGDNGGDALFAGERLAQAGVRVIVMRTGARVHEAGLDAAVTAGARVEESVGPADDERMRRLVADADVVVDGILGIGATPDPALRGHARRIVAAILPLLGPPLLDGERRTRVVAVDLPSGVHPDDGSVPDETVLPADVTVTFGGVKAGLLRAPGSRYAGEVRLVDVGLDLSGTDPVG